MKAIQLYNVLGKHTQPNISTGRELLSHHANTMHYDVPCEKANLPLRHHQKESTFYLEGHENRKQRQSIALHPNKQWQFETEDDMSRVDFLLQRQFYSSPDMNLTRQAQ